ncbi:hypothetical protein C8J56DRAFT_884437 [Mycena floridula]|nr:hypothetical protein C8J56DRAFT_884437 [Mycena floridula]
MIVILGVFSIIAFAASPLKPTSRTLRLTDGAVTGLGFTVALVGYSELWMVRKDDNYCMDAWDWVGGGGFAGEFWFLLRLFLQIICLNQGLLEVCDPTLVVPVFYGLYTATGFLNSLIFNDKVKQRKGKKTVDEEADREEGRLWAIGEASDDDDDRVEGGLDRDDVNE